MPGHIICEIEIPADTKHLQRLTWKSQLPLWKHSWSSKNFQIRKATLGWETLQEPLLSPHCIWGALDFFSTMPIPPHPL